MLSSRPARRWRVSVEVCALAVVSAVALGLTTVPVRGSGNAGAAIVLPPGPAKAGFDVSRANFGLYRAFEPFLVDQTRPLREALSSKLVAADTDLLIAETSGGPIALITEQMAYHHLAQGRAGNRDWLVSFCVVCNTGTGLVPVVNGTATGFEIAGVYDGMLVMQDVATRSIWNHITGEALYGPAVGATLGAPTNVLQLTVKQAMALHPAARIAISDRLYFAGGRRHGSREGIALLGRVHARPGDRAGRLSNVFAATLGQEDTRRPRMDIGLGIWSEAGSRYYPRDVIRRNGGALIDRVDGKSLLVYLDPVTSTPAAIFVDGTSARIDRSTVRLDTRQSVRDGVLFDSQGRRMTAERPLQVFSRWYGFALTFPATTIYGEG
jgi:hypothetical protein